MDISPEDMKLLQFLMFKGRKSDAEIASSIRMSPTIVGYKIKRFQEQGLIKGYEYKFNPYKLGYDNNALFMIKMNNPEEFQRLTEETLNHPSVTDIFSISGMYDIAVQAFFRGLSDLKAFTTWINDKFRDHASEIITVMGSDVYKMHHINFPKSHIDFDLTETDYNILQEKIKHSGHNIKQISRDLNLHRNTVSARWNKMWKEELIIKKSVLINPQYYGKLGTGFNTLLSIKTDAGFENEFIEKLSNLQEVHSLMTLSHTFKIMASIRIKNTSGYEQLIDKVYDIGHVRETLTNVVFRSFKKPLYPARINSL